MRTSRPYYLAVLTMLATSPASAQTETICKALEALMDAHLDMSGLRNERLESGDWAAKISLPGFERCSLFIINSGLGYRCQSVYENVDDVRSASFAMAERIWSCPFISDRMISENRVWGPRMFSWYFSVDSGLSFTLTMGDDLVIDASRMDAQFKPVMEFIMFEE